jgi:hypothetical protein
MTEEAGESPGEIRNIAERALVLQSYVLRRSWGALYAVWGSSMLVTIFISPIEADLELRIAINLVVSASALVAVLWTFKRARDTAEVRYAIFENTWSRPLGYRVLLPIWLAIYALVILTVFFFRPGVVYALLTVYAALAAYCYYALRLSFPLRLPKESIVALSSFAFATVASIALLPFLRGTEPYGILWAATIGLWLLAAVYARTRRPPMLSEGSTIER